MVTPAASFAAEVKTNRGPRPWTVYALAVLYGPWTILQTVIDGVEAWDIAAVVLTAFVVWGIWVGRTWLYVLLWLVSVLPLFGLVLASVISLVYGVPLTSFPASAIVFSAIELLLLWHPQTRRFAGLWTPREKAA